MSVFTLQHNEFNGTTVQLSTAPISAADIEALLVQLNALGKALVWITVPQQRAELVPLLTSAGFVFHLCDEQSLTMIYRLHKDAYAPFTPTHTLGVGGLVQNSAGEVLLVRDKWMGGKGLKLPGGYVDLGEDIASAVQREVREESGVNGEFHSVIGLITKHPHAFNKSNQYLICRLTLLNPTIEIHDSDEIELACWQAPDVFLANEENPRFHRHLVSKLCHVTGIKADDYDFRDPLSQKHMYLADTSEIQD